MYTQPTPTQLTPGYRHSLIRVWHELLFSLNLAVVCCYWFLSYCQDFGMFQPSRKRDFGYHLRAYSLRLNDFLHIASQEMQFARYAPKFMASRAASLGAELLILFSTLAVAYLFFVILHAATAPSIQKILKPLAGMTSIFALPVMYIWLLKTGWAPWTVHGFWQDFRPAVLGAEILLYVLLILISRVHSLSLWMILPLVLAHDVFWLYFSWPHFYALPRNQLLSPLSLLLAFPASNVLWLLYIKTGPEPALPPVPNGKHLPTTLLAFAALTILFLLWRPASTHPLRQFERTESLIIELHRSRCFGRCRPYHMTIRGNGDVQFTGWHVYPETEYTVHATLAREQVSQILEILDRSRFTALDERAFVSCSDTQTVDVSFSVKDWSKRVGSDSYCVGAKSGPQARFVGAAAEIDSIVGTKQLIER
jgi:hypothetical protein